MIDENTPWNRFLNLLALEKKDIAQIFYYAIISGILALSLPLGIQAIVNLIQGAQISTSWVVLVTLVTLGVILVGVLNLMQLRIIETIQQRIFVNSSFELSYRFPKITMEALRNKYPPELANRFFDTLIIQKGLSKVLIDVPAALLQVIFALILLSFYNPLFIVFGMILLVAVYLVFLYTAKKGLSTSLEESKFKYKVAHWIQEIARSIVSFKLSGKTNLAIHKNDILVEQYLKARESHFKIIKLQYIKLIVFKALVTSGLLLIGGILVLNQKLNIGQFVAAEIIILLVITSIEKLILGLETLYDMLTSIEKLGSIFEIPLELQDGETPNFDKGIFIELDAIKYEVANKSKPILVNISLNINPKSRIIIQGESGSGKSSLLRVLSGIIKPTSGAMIINGFDAKGVNINHYRGHLGLSLSEEFPFEGTLRENLTYGDHSISDEEILNVLNHIGLSKFLRDSPKGLNTILYPEGKQMSYTISKKIVLGRAILKKPKVLILEDALDQFSKEETQQIIDYLSKSTNPWALIVVSNNNYWKTYCNEVINLHDGTITFK